MRIRCDAHHGGVVGLSENSGGCVGRVERLGSGGRSSGGFIGVKFIGADMSL